ILSAVLGYVTANIGSRLTAVFFLDSHANPNAASSKVQVPVLRPRHETAVYGRGARRCNTPAAGNYSYPALPRARLPPKHSCRPPAAVPARRGGELVASSR